MSYLLDRTKVLLIGIYTRLLFILILTVDLWKIKSFYINYDKILTGDHVKWHFGFASSLPTREWFHSCYFTKWPRWALCQLRKLYLSFHSYTIRQFLSHRKKVKTRPVLWSFLLLERHYTGITLAGRLKKTGLKQKDTAAIIMCLWKMKLGFQRSIVNSNGHL